MRATIIAALLVALVAAGCAKNSTNSSVTSASPEASAEATEAPAASPPVTLSGKVNNHGTKDLSAQGKSGELELEQDNFYFNPTFVKAAPGATVTIKLKNEGKVPHTFTIDSLHIDQELQPDQSKTITVTLQTSGTVNFYCRFHKAMGMQGAFFYAAGGAASTDAPVTSTSSSGY